jgi:hypothetical protein
MTYLGERTQWTECSIRRYQGNACGNNNMRRRVLYKQKVVVYELTLCDELYVDSRGIAGVSRAKPGTWRWRTRLWRGVPRRWRDTGLEGDSTAVSLAAGSAGHADFLRVDTMAADTMADTMGADTMADMAAVTMGVAFSALDILTSTRFIIPTITRILSTGLIWDTKSVRPSRPHAESGSIRMGIEFC